MKQFEQGKKQLFLEALDVFESLEKWDEIYDFCRQGLSLLEDEGVPSYLAADWRVWKRFIAAASKKSDDEA
jgi:N-terminal acetyltransferase B complex non-catalytic subunit